MTAVEHGLDLAMVRAKTRDALAFGDVNGAAQVMIETLTSNPALRDHPAAALAATVRAAGGLRTKPQVESFVKEHLRG